VIPTVIRVVIHETVPPKGCPRRYYIYVNKLYHDIFLLEGKNLSIKDIPPHLGMTSEHFAYFSKKFKEEKYIKFLQNLFIVNNDRKNRNTSFSFIDFINALIKIDKLYYYVSTTEQKFTLEKIFQEPLFSLKNLTFNLESARKWSITRAINFSSQTIIAVVEFSVPESFSVSLLIYFLMKWKEEEQSAQSNAIKSNLLKKVFNQENLVGSYLLHKGSLTTPTLPFDSFYPKNSLPDLSDSTSSTLTYNKI
jgi:hypothetical protein